MSQEFLDRLLNTSENRVQSEGDAICMICLEEYNTLNTLTGIIEAQIRLPCGHGVGSSCIVTWLKTNKNCPVCRTTFFSAQPRPYLEHGIMNADMPRTALNSILDIVSILRAFVEYYCPALGVILPSDTVGIVAISMASSMARSGAPHLIDLHQRQTQRCVAAASLYMASHVMRRPKTPLEIARVSGLRAHEITFLYSQIYPIRMQLVNVQALEHIVGGHIEGMLAFLPSPDRGNEVIDEEEERRELQNFRIDPPNSWSERIENCLRHSMELGGPRIETICGEIATAILDERHLGLRSQMLVVAIGFYMSSHLLGSGASFQRIGELVRIDGRILGMAYARVYPLRNQLIKPSMLSQIGLENLPRAIEALPALNWPPLEE